MKKGIYFYPRGRSALACAWALNKFCGAKILGFLDDNFKDSIESGATLIESSRDSIESKKAKNAHATERERERERSRFA